MKVKELIERLEKMDSDDYVRLKITHGNIIIKSAAKPKINLNWLRDPEYSRFPVVMIEASE